MTAIWVMNHVHCGEKNFWVVVFFPGQDFNLFVDLISMLPYILFLPRIIFVHALLVFYNGDEVAMGRLLCMIRFDWLILRGLVYCSLKMEKVDFRFKFGNRIVIIIIFRYYCQLVVAMHDGDGWEVVSGGGFGLGRRLQ